jgi:hypothetical protein
MCVCVCVCVRVRADRHRQFRAALHVHVLHAIREYLHLMLRIRQYPAMSREERNFCLLWPCFAATFALHRLHVMLKLLG